MNHFQVEFETIPKQKDKFIKRKNRFHENQLFIDCTFGDVST